MVKKGESKAALAPLKSGILSKKSAKPTIGSLERSLLADFPAEDAFEWDRTGLLVGDRAKTVDRVCVALDPTVEAVRQSEAAGANVLVTHHPAFILPPESFQPLSEGSSVDAAGAIVWEAISRGVALMNFHTALDVTPSAANILPSMMGLEVKGVLQPLAAKPKKGIGQICVLSATDKGMTLDQLAARCTSVFARPPRVWGERSESLGLIAVCSGSAGDVVSDAINAHADVLVCGEIRYHDALAAIAQGLAVIELGHDVSELPYVAPLMAAVERAGVPKEAITAINQGMNWKIPETTRL